MTIELNAAAKKFSIPWRNAKEKILGKRFQLSAALLSEQEMRRVRRILRLEKKYRFGPRHALNVLAFLFDAHAGEILLNKERVQKEARRQKRPFRLQLLYLYIHGLLHLKGYDHTKEADEKRMKRQEEKFFDYFCQKVKS